MSKGVTTERRGEIVRELFEILIEHPDGLQASDAIRLVEKRMQLTDHEAGLYGEGTKRFDRILRFNTIGPVKAGWMIKNKGIWSITEEGIEAYKTYTDPESFSKEISFRYNKWKKAQPEEELDEDSQKADASITLEEAEEQAWKEITYYLEHIDPYDLQEVVASLLESMGYHINWISPPGKDGGLDILAFTDPLGTKPPRIKVQVKRRKDNIGVEELRSFLALINQDDVGIYVTTGGYSKDALVLARQQETRRIMLIDRQKLVDLWVEYQGKIDPRARDSLPLRPIYFLDLND